MANVQNVARFFIDLAQRQAQNGRGDLMTNLRLQKMLYFAQGWHLARYGTPLFDDEIEAWQYGPVVPSVYNAYSGCGRSGITNTQPVQPGDFTEDEYSLLLDVAREYGRYATSALVNISHRKGAPWHGAAYRGMIPKEDMLAYFSAEKPLSDFQKIVTQKLPVITPERDENGTAVLPTEYDDDWDEYDDD